MLRATKVWLTAEQQDDFERFARSRTLAARLVERARIVLQAATGKADVEIAQTLDITRQTVGLWRRRFAEQGISGIEKDAPHSGRPRLIPASKIDEIVSLTTRQTPSDATHWSRRTLAAVAAVSPSTVGRIWLLAAAGQGAILAVPVGTTPPLLSGGGPDTGRSELVSKETMLTD